MDFFTYLATNGYNFLTGIIDALMAGPAMIIDRIYSWGKPNLSRNKRTTRMYQLVLTAELLL